MLKTSIVRHKKVSALFILGAALIGLCASLLVSYQVFAFTAPSYTLNGSTTITARGGFLSIKGDPGQVFDGTRYIGDAGNKNYDAKKQEVYFVSKGNGVYATDVTYGTRNFLQGNGGSLCTTAIKVTLGSTTGEFVGYSPSAGKVTADCTAAVKKVERTAGSAILGNLSADIGEEFQGVAIPRCQQSAGTQGYVSCTNQRRAALAEAGNNIQCTTTSPEGIAACNYNKKILACIMQSVTELVANCKARQDARAILDGDFTVINAQTTDADIKDICSSLNNVQLNQKCIQDATAQRDKLKNSAAGEEASTCGIDGIGWIVCPVFTFMAVLNDSAFGFLQSLLAIRPSLINDPATKQAWSAFRDIANVAFIIAFLVIVYSQLSGVGISNYGIKKLLPRIFVSAVLVNLSFFICVLAVDASNIVGSSVNSLLGSAIPVGTDGATNGAFANGWKDTVGPILAGGAAFVVLLIVIIPVLPAVLLALAVILFILIARQALVILLIVVAPLAFVAYLLPNTESWFKKWRQAFFAVLMVYPIIGVIFGASTLAATILMEVSNDTPGNANDEQLLKIVALATLALPLFAVPLALKGSLSAAGAVGNKLSGLADKTNRMAGKQMGERAGQKVKGIRDAASIAATNRSGIFGGQGRMGRAFGATGGYLAQRGARREQFYDTLGRRRKSADETFLNTNDRTAARERRAVGAEETAGLAKEANKNAGKLEHMRDNTNHGAYTAAQQSGLELHDEEAVHKAAATQTYLGNAQNNILRTQAVQAGASASNTEETVKNTAMAGHLNEPANQQQYIDLNDSRGTVKNATLAQDRTFEGTATGLNQAMERRETESDLEIIRSEQKAAYDGTAAGVSQAVLKDATAKRQAISSAAGEAAAIASNTDIRVNAQAAQDEVEVAKADESAFISELRTVEGAAQNLISQQSQEVQDTVQRLQVADRQKRVQAQRTASATGVANVEYAGQVAASENVPGGLAEIAGGIDNFGARRAVSAAQQVEVEQFVKNVKTEQSTMSKANDDDLHKIATDSAVSVERRAAAAGMIMKGGSMGSIHRLTKHFKETLPEGDPERANVRNIQMQMSDDMSRVPFGFGDRDRSALRRGELGQVVEQRNADGDIITDSAGNPIKTADTRTYEEMLASRVQEKMSGDEWRTMDPDDRSAIVEIARTNPDLLGTDGRRNLINAFSNINSTDVARNATKTDAKKAANRITTAFGEPTAFTDVT